MNSIWVLFGRQTSPGLAGGASYAAANCVSSQNVSQVLCLTAIFRYLGAKGIPTCLLTRAHPPHPLTGTDSCTSPA